MTNNKQNGEIEDMTTEQEIFEIVDSKNIGDLLVKRINMTDLDVIQNGKIIFSGEDYEVAEFINTIGTK
ncbi:hypothetical protein [Bacillus sp. T9C1]|uniref:hypothetical protein n=1 Tax=Bacillus sp. T9C1 TaxID=2918912 RepID=UPI00227DB638|nr:hypothetical protein [Bacillus sp. T9C1]